ncbi:MAG TPA: SRPBCC domain-containing protein [Alphaproteobacteria bacterium]|nr:SRPBCC domain-containing protein [Alphaproteobacteria bacterium]
MKESGEPVAFEVPPIVKQVTIAKPVDQVFRMFTAENARWWPLKGYSVGKEAANFCAIEPRAGGRVFERSEQGTECDWGTVLIWDPPRAFACSWNPPHPEHPIETAQRVEVRFVAESPAVTASS